jgi:hypothetical protein
MQSNMQLKLYPLLPLAALLFTACSSDNDDNTDNALAEGTLPIRVSASLSTSSTRGTGVGHINFGEPHSLFKSGQNIDLFLLEYGNTVSDTTSWRYNGTTPIYLQSDNGGNFVWYNTATARTDGTPRVTKFWSPTGNSISFFAWHPAGCIASIFSNQSFTVSTEQGADDGDAANDLMIGLPNAGNPVVPTADEIPLNFTHRLAKLSVKIDADGGSAVIKDMMKKAKITLGNEDIFLETIMNPRTGSVMTNSDGEKGTITLKNHDVPMVDNEDHDVDNFCLIPQQNISGKLLTIILNSGEEIPKTIPQHLAQNIFAEAGKAYTITLNISSEGKIRLVVDVAPWTENNQDLDLRNPE